MAVRAIDRPVHRDGRPAVEAAQKIVYGFALRGDQEFVGIQERDPIEFQPVGLAGRHVGQHLAIRRPVLPIMKAYVVVAGGGLDQGGGAVGAAIVEDDLGVEARQRVEGDPFLNVRGLVTHDQADGGFQDQVLPKAVGWPLTTCGCILAHICYPFVMIGEDADGCAG
jgi:hypothetical protein